MIFLCETCRQPGATAHPAGHFCRAHRPRPSLLELVDLAEAAAKGERLVDLLRLLGLLREAVEGRPASMGE